MNDLENNDFQILFSNNGLIYNRKINEFYTFKDLINEISNKISYKKINIPNLIKFNIRLRNIDINLYPDNKILRKDFIIDKNYFLNDNKELFYNKDYFILYSYIDRNNFFIGKKKFLYNKKIIEHKKKYINIQNLIKKILIKKLAKTIKIIFPIKIKMIMEIIIIEIIIIIMEIIIILII